MTDPGVGSGLGAMVGGIASTIAAKLNRFAEQHQPAQPPDLGATFKVSKGSGGARGWFSSTPPGAVGREQAPSSTRMQSGQPGLAGSPGVAASEPPRSS
jgi:hypothetical protein